MTNRILIRDVIGFQTLYNNLYWHSLDTIDVLNDFRRYIAYSEERWNYVRAKKEGNLSFSNGYLIVNGEKAFPIARRLNKEEKEEIKEYITHTGCYI